MLIRNALIVKIKKKWDNASIKINKIVRKLIKDLIGLAIRMVHSITAESLSNNHIIKTRTLFIALKKQFCN